MTVGIEKLKQLAKVAGNLATNVIYLDSDKDGKVEVQEIFAAGQDILMSAWSLISDFDISAIKAEIADLDLAEAKELVDAFNAELKLESPEADEIVVRVLNTVLDLVDLFSAIKNLKK